MAKNLRVSLNFLSYALSEEVKVIKNDQKVKACPLIFFEEKLRLTPSRFNNFWLLFKTQSVAKKGALTFCRSHF
jgi:hypothetical protein